jgi:predicted dehydrogenase
MSRKQSSGSSRREFITTTATAVAAVTIVPRHVLGGPGFVAPSDKVNVAVIGVGGQGRTNLRSLYQQDDCQVIALADPCEEWDLSPYYYGGKAGRGPVLEEIEKHYREKTPNYKCAVYEDFRVMLEKEKEIDAVLIATPDHLHAYASILAMKAGKHVYCEKPLTLDIAEGRLVARIAKETGVATQLGNYGRSSEGHRLTAEWIWDGAIGAVREVHAWGRAGGFARGMGRPKETPDVPANLNWDLWLGPSEKRPYHPAYAPFTWRGWWAFGGGGMPDVAVHHLDPAFNALKLDSPLSVEATAPGIVDSEVCSTGVLATYRFGPRGNLGPVSVYWYDGGLRPPTPPGIDPDDPVQRMGEGFDGIYFVGEKGIITCAGWSGMPRLLPLELHREYKRPEKTLARVEGHHADWLQACKGGTPASSNFEYGARLCEFIQLGIVALRTRKLIKWDSANMKATNAPEADAFIKGKPYREGWELPV